MQTCNLAGDKQMILKMYQLVRYTRVFLQPKDMHVGWLEFRNYSELFISNVRKYFPFYKLVENLHTVYQGCCLSLRNAVIF